jgi:hypothetical protein
MCLALFRQPTLRIPPNDAGTAAAGDGKLPGTFPSLRLPSSIT